MRLLALLCLLVGLTASPLRAGAGGSRADVGELCRRLEGLDVDGDGRVELRSLRPFAEAGRDAPLVLVLVEPRLLVPTAGAPDLVPKIARLTADLAREGLRAAAVAVELGPSPRHQDGLYVLALRELLRAAAAEGELAGALLVGHFPDALVVRTCNWRKEGAVERDGQVVWRHVPFLRRVPEDVARRADVVLADLDGRWEERYVGPRTRLETAVAVFLDGVPEHGGPCTDLVRGAVEFEDFFHVSDGKLEVAELVGEGGARAGLSVALYDAADHESSAADRERPNVLARPDVGVSRIDAKGVALQPRADVRGVDGEGLLDADGEPRAVRFASEADVPHWRDELWEPDPVLERRLLALYLDRNHAWRTGAAPVSWRPASLACDLPSGFARVRRAADDWEELDAELDVHGRPTLLDAVEWLARPAVLRTLRAHSDPRGSVFRKADPAPLDARLGAPAWSWARDGATLVPSLASACGGGKLGWFLLRTLWERGLVAEEPSFWVHTGCHGLSPPGALELAYGDPAYGVRQGAEALLFFANGLALVGRAKVFYDEPRGFCEALGEGERFGTAWMRYFEVESRASSWSEVGGDIGRKRAYFWSVLGDWTLRVTRSGS